MNVLLQAQGLTMHVGDRTLFHDISMSVGEGQRIGLIARNGTGKTTLLNILAGADTADSGKVIVTSGLRIGYLPQEPQYPMELTVLEACFWHARQVQDDTEEALALEVRSMQILDKLKNIKL